MFRPTWVLFYGSYSAGRISLETRSGPVGVEYLCESLRLGLYEHHRNLYFHASQVVDVVSVRPARN